jgi:hypothetical protein
MKRNSVFVLLGIFIALLALVALQSLRPNTTDTKEQGIPNRLFAWNADQLQAFSIRDPYTNATLSFQRDDKDHWEFVELPEAIPDQEGVERIAITVSVLPYLEVLTEVTPEDYPDFGLTQTDAFLIIVALLKNGEEHTVIVGDVASGNVSHYALVDDRPEVYVLDARPIAFLVSIMKQVYEPTPVPTAEATAEITTTP